MASFNSGMPSTAVYLVLPLLIACIAAFLICKGVSKSGSPAPNPIISFPSFLSSLAFDVTAIVGDGFMLLTLLDIKLCFIINYLFAINSISFLKDFK